MHKYAKCTIQSLILKSLDIANNHSNSHQIKEKKNACNIMIYHWLEDNYLCTAMVLSCRRVWLPSSHTQPKLNQERRKKKSHQCKLEPTTWGALQDPPVIKKKIKKSQAFISKSCCHRFSILTQDRQSYPWISLQLLKKPYPHSGCHKRK